MDIDPMNQPQLPGGFSRPDIGEEPRLKGFAKLRPNGTISGMTNGPDSGDPLQQEKDAVLLIDDEQPLLDVFVAALEPLFEVSTARSTKEAELILRQKKFKVVVSDHLMPGGNGMSLLVRAREEYPEMQRVLVTAYMKPEMLLRSVNEAALFRYLLKPVSLAELVAVVQEAAKAYNQTVARTTAG
jgi:DNA-binding NtrC family response regulator